MLISIVEFLYPLLQAQGLGRDPLGRRARRHDQTFNLLVGRDLQGRSGQEPQIAFTLPLLEGLDGVQKMSKSLGNYVGIAEAPEDMFGKLMRVPDHLIGKYLAPHDGPGSGRDRGCWKPTRKAGGPGAGSREAPPRASSSLPSTTATEAAEESGTTLRSACTGEHELPDEVVESDDPLRRRSPTAVSRCRGSSTGFGLADSTSKARDLIKQGGVKLDTDAGHGARDAGRAVAGRVLQVGKRSFRRLLA